MTSDNFLQFCASGGVDLARLKVMIYVFEHTNPETYEVKCSYDKIANSTGVSFSAVVNTLKDAQEIGMVSNIGRGKWKLNERIFEPDGYEKPLFEIRNYK